MSLPFSPLLGEGYLDEVLFWTIEYYEPSEERKNETVVQDYDPDDPQVEIIGKLELPEKWIEQRANREYNSPFFNGEPCGHHKFKVSDGVFENRQGGWYQFNYRTGKVLKIYKPIGCKKIEIYGIYVSPSGNKIKTSSSFEFSEEQTKYMMVISFSNNSEDVCPEGFLHENEERYYKVNEFYIPEHLTQINGSNFCISKNEYFDKTRNFINSLQVRSVPEYQNFSLSRTFQKFFIGGYKI